MDPDPNRTALWQTSRFSGTGTVKAVECGSAPAWIRIHFISCILRADPDPRVYILSEKLKKCKESST